jgi:hypothetical protein
MSACSVDAPTNDPEQEATGTATMPNPQVFITPAPDVDDAVSAYMDAWVIEDYDAMYHHAYTCTKSHHVHTKESIVQSRSHIHLATYT